MGRANWLYFLGTKSNKYEHFIYGISLPTSNVNRYNLNNRLGKIGNKRLYVFESITDDIDIPNLKNNSIDLNLYHKDVKETLSSCTNSATLHVYAFNYNWNDGFDLPQTIIDNPACTLGTALMIFYLADGYR